MLVLQDVLPRNNKEALKRNVVQRITNLTKKAGKITKVTFRKHILTKDYRTSAAASEFAYHKLKQIKYPYAVICSLSSQTQRSQPCRFLCSWGRMSPLLAVALARRTKF